MSLSKAVSKEVGFVTSAQDYLLFLEGLPSAKINDLIVSKTGSRAIVQSLEKEKIEAWMLDPERPKPGDTFELTSEGLKLPLRSNLFGRIINPLGVTVDGKAPLPPSGGLTLDLDVVAPGIDGREIITKQFYTGLTVVDTLLPIGRGQRELLFGEARSGKSTFLLDMIVHQKNKNCICIYTAIGRSEIDVKRFGESIEKEGASPFTIVIASTSSDAAPLIAIAPSVGCSVAEYYRDQGKDVLLILDDFATHSKYLREIYLLSGRIPGRESYPADIFFQHSHLVERAGSFNEKYNKGAITLLPVIETDIENFTNLIPTNVMSMTDGHILFSASLRAQGQYPAIEPDRSVTRVGRQTQTFIHKVLSDRIRSLIADYHELERYGRFGSELTAQTQMVIKRGKITEELLKQDPLAYVDPEIQIMMLSLVFSGYFDEKDVEFVRQNKNIIIKTLSENNTFREIRAKIKSVELDPLITDLKNKHSILETACQQSQTSKKS